MRYFRLGLASFCLLAFPSLLLAQSGNATLSGTVRDSSGALLAGAEVTVKNTATGVRHVVTSSEVGLYFVPGLIPGPYEVRVHANGFQDRTITDIQLVIDQQARLDIGLNVASQGQTVTVTAAPPLLQEQDASVGTVIDSQHVQDLPLNGRQFTQLLQLSPGAVPDINSTLYKNANPAQAGRQRNGNPVFAVNGASGHGCRGLSEESLSPAV
jgi:hypothetical protein